MTTDVAILVTCHGTVETAAQIPDFVKNIRRGRPAPAEVVAEVTRRFEEIGGSPLMKITQAQADALSERVAVPVVAASRLWAPYPSDVLRPLIEQGLRKLISLPLAPQSVHIYNGFVHKQLEGTDLSIVDAPAYGLEPALVGAFADAIMETYARFDSGERVGLVLSAHSLPLRVLAAGDPYQRDFEAMAEAVAAELATRGVERTAIRIAYQSQGMGGGEWLGPDLPEVFGALHGDGFDALLVAPIGFVAEHVETLYDIDVEAAGMAREQGFTKLLRMPAMNTRTGFIDALAKVAQALLSQKP